MNPQEQLRVRFWQHATLVTPDESICCTWTGNVSNGHARFRLRPNEQELFDGKQEVSAHLVAWWLTHNEHQKFVDRVCGNKLCVRPSHLEVRSEASRFWSKVDRTTTPDGCWPWIGGKHTFGYGSTAKGSAHRRAYELSIGPIPPGHVVRHKCHNPVCCRPDHLTVGTQHDNVHDAIAAGRMHYTKGERVGNAKFSDVQATALRAVFKALRATHRQNAALEICATLLDVTPRTVWRAVRGISYQNAPQELPTSVETLVKHYRVRGFPWAAAIEDVTDQPIRAVRNAKVTVEDNTVKSVSFAGQQTCLAAHPHRLEARHTGQRSVVEAFNNDKTLARALKYQLDRGDPVTPKRLLRALAALVRAPRNFPPALARWITDTYVPVNGIVLDPCSGYGGRLLGVLASTKNASYVGYDIESRSVAGNLTLAKQLGAEDRVQQECRAVEDATAWPSVDVVFTSPPYYDVEDYGVAATAALTRYSSYAAWRDGFLQKLVTLALAAAPIVVLNVAKTPKGDIPADVITMAGSASVQVLNWPLRKFGARGREEKIIVLRRCL